MGFSRGLPGSERDLIERALGIAERDGLTFWRIRALRELGQLDFHDTGRVDRLAEARGLALGAGAVSTAASIDLTMSMLLMNQFRCDDAIEAARRCADASRRFQLGILGWGLLIQAAANAWKGRRPEMERILAELSPLADGDPSLAACVWGDCRGFLAMFEEDRSRALADLDRAVAVSPRFITNDAPYRGLWALVRTAEDADGDAAREEVRATAGTVAWWVRAMLTYADAVALSRRGQLVEAERTASDADLEVSRQVRVTGSVTSGGGSSRKRRSATGGEIHRRGSSSQRRSTSRLATTASASPAAASFGRRASVSGVAGAASRWSRRRCGRSA